VVIGGFDDAAAETYEARCHRHHEIGEARHPATTAGSVLGDRPG
jgi:thymidine kinase